MNIHEAHEYAEYLSSDIAKLVPNHPVLKKYFGSVWQEIDAKETAYNKELKKRAAQVIMSTRRNE